MASIVVGRGGGGALKEGFAGSVGAGLETKVFRTGAAGAEVILPAKLAAGLPELPEVVFLTGLPGLLFFIMLKRLEQGLCQAG